METRRRVESMLDFERWSGEAWVVTGATLRERLNEPYLLHVDALTAEPMADAAALLGSPVTLTLDRRGVVAHVCGFVTMVRDGLDAEHRSGATFMVEPALAALRHRTDSRIFQNLTVPQILEQVLSAGLSRFGRAVELRLAASYPQREYTVQYQETDFDFVHRLMEEEGIGYAFEHDGDQELMVLFDQPAHFVELEGEDASTLRFVERLDEEIANSEGVSRFEGVARVRPNRVATRHFDWTHPSVPMEGSAEMSDPSWPALESYVHDAPLTFHSYDHTYGAHNANDQLRLEAERARRDARRSDGTSSALGMRAGRRFTLAGHRRADQDGEWSVVGVEHRYLDHVRDASATYLNRFQVIPAAVPWRPDRTRDRPRIVGVQTASVVGPAGEEIHCDVHGRIKVQFHWDRLGTRDEHSSCWIRVVQTMGGAGWGFSFIPRIGMEVVVTFVEGDPDRPLVTGVVYNGENPCPYEFPADKTRLTLKTNSSPGGAGFNELRFEDRAGEEEIWLHGQKDWNTLILHDLTRKVGNDEAQEVVVDRTRKVGHDETVEVGNNKMKRIGVDETEQVGNNRTREVGKVEQITIGTDRIKSVGANETVTIGQNATQSIGQNLSQTVGASLSQTVAQSVSVDVGASAARNVVQNDALKVGGNAEMEVGENLSQTVRANLTQRVKANASSDVGGNRSSKVGLMDTLQVTGIRNVTVGGASTEQVGLMKRIDAGQSITLSCGDSSITLEASGKISIKGKAVEINGDDTVALTAGLITLN